MVNALERRTMPFYEVYLFLGVNGPSFYNLTTPATYRLDKACAISLIVNLIHVNEDINTPSFVHIPQPVKSEHYVASTSTYNNRAN